MATSRWTAPYLPSLLVAAFSGALAWYGWSALGTAQLVSVIHAGQVRYAGPVVLAVVAVTFAAERVWPAQRRRVLACGHLADVGYLVLYASVTLPVSTLIGAGFATALSRHASWLTLPAYPAVPSWAFVVIGLVAIDATDWLVHFLNHRFNPLWRFHAVHHSQEEVSVLTTFRAHPLVHLSFAFTALPGFVLAANGATPVTLLTAYACLGAVPHANVPWTYGPVGRLIISPAYHRAHHRAAGRTDVNLGVVFPFWDELSGRAIRPVPGGEVIATGLAGRPIPVEQERLVEQERPACSLPGLVATQLVEPFRR
ncbi:MAG: fatty acid hydroxylase family protein [Jatrophihabitans sp.]|nr:fatty acid hydroxylase family protein [Jatrophihabitans sp.]